MQASVGDELQWRLRLYDEVLEKCRRGGFTLARFLALAPDWLRLSVGDSRSTAEIPVGLSDAWVAELGARLPVGSVDEAALPERLYQKDAELRQLVRLSQVDGSLDPVRVGLWYRQHAMGWLESLGAVYQKALREVGQGASGDETAYLVHQISMEAVKRAASYKLGSEPDAASAAIVSAAVSFAVQGSFAVGTGPDDDATRFSAKLGMQIFLTQSPLSYLDAAVAMVRLPLNAYRTIPEVVALTSTEPPQSLEAFQPLREASSLAEAALSKAPVVVALAKDLFLELVRDCALLATFQLYERKPTRAQALVRRLSSSSRALAGLLADEGKRTSIQEELRAVGGTAQGPLSLLVRLLDEAPNVWLGKVQGLGPYGDLSARARIAAAGAVAFRLDQAVQRIRREVTSTLRWVPAARQRAEYERGRLYFVASGPEPLFRVVTVRTQAQLFVDMKDFTLRTAAIRERAMGDFLKRFFYDPIFELAARIQAGKVESLQVSNVVGDAVAFRGEIAPVVKLALGIRQILEKASNELGRTLSDSVGGRDPAVAEIEEEVGRVVAALSELEVAPPTPENLAKRKSFQTQRTLLEEGLAERRQKGVGLGLEAGVFVSFGSEAEVIDLSHPTWGPWNVVIAERLNEAARGTARSSVVKAERDSMMARARAETGQVRLEWPFAVRCGRSYQMELPTALTESLGSAIYRQDREGITQAIKSLAQALQQQASERVARQENALPKSIVASGEFYNAGCALSGAALDAFEQALAKSWSFVRAQLYRTQLSSAFTQRYHLDQEPESFVFALDRRSSECPVFFRHAGRARFRGFEKQGEVDVWELLLHDNPFGKALLSEAKRLGIFSGLAG